MYDPTEIARLVASYPRQRPPLPSRQAALFDREYAINRTGGSLINRVALHLESWMHRDVARGATLHPGDVLELGAGTLNHLDFEQHLATYDAVEPYTNLVDLTTNRRRLRNLFSSIDEIPDGQRYARIISIAVLEHLVDLPRVIARSALLLEPGGLFQAAIPSEGGFLWGLAWRSTTGLAYRLRTGVSYAPVMRHEHVSDQWQILQLMQSCFTDVTIRRHPALGSHGSLYTSVCARNPNLMMANTWLEVGRVQSAG